MLNIWSESRINEQFILSTWKVWTRYSSQLEQTPPRGKKKLSRIVKYWWDKMERNMINKKCRRRVYRASVLFSPLTSTNGVIHRETRSRRNDDVKKFSRQLVVDSKREYRKGKRPWWPCATRKFLSIRECTLRSGATRLTSDTRACVKR